MTTGSFFKTQSKWDNNWPSYYINQYNPCLLVVFDPRLHSFIPLWAISLSIFGVVTFDKRFVSRLVGRERFVVKILVLGLELC